MKLREVFKIRQPAARKIIGISVLLIGCMEPKNDGDIYSISCENLIDPIGIGTDIPRFSWKTRSELKGTSQSAYQILVASDSNRLQEDLADLWNSGRIPSHSSVLIPYCGKGFGPGSVAFWKVRMWNEKDKASGWSETGRFTIGLLGERDWQATYIGMPEIEKGLSGSPMFRATFSLDATNSKLLLYVNSLGYHEVYLNGNKVGDAVLSPAVSQFNRRSQVMAYDITSGAKPGKNDLVIWLGRGWYSKGLPGVVHSGPVVRAQLELSGAGNREIILSTNTTAWKGRMSEYYLTGTFMPGDFGGEQVDGSRIISDWSTDGLDRLPWSPVIQVAVPGHQATAQAVEPNRIHETIRPDTVIDLGGNIFMADMGKNLTGLTRVNFSPLQKGQEITLEYSDHLDQEGRFVENNQKDYYLASGSGQEFFINKFNYHGFRYIKLSNLPEKPDREDITAYLVHTDYGMTSRFTCSDPDMNRIHDMIRYTIRCLSLGGDLVDCPQIERLGYGGDGNASTETAQNMFELAPLYANWLQAWGDCIREDGGMPHTAPNPYRAGGGPYWCGFIITASWRTFMNYGDSLVLKKYYPVMQKWLGYVEKHSTSGILKRWPDTDYRTWYLGDWASPEGIDETSENTIDLVSNSFICICYDRMNRIATVLGKHADALQYAQKRNDLRQKIHQVFYDPVKHIYANGYQIDLCFPLLAGIVPDSLVGRVKESLHYEIEKNRNGHIACGLVGIPVLTEWAIDDQAADLMYSMLKKKDYPGYLFMIENGATTTWENWKNPRSYIHNCFNGIGAWFYQAVGGIRMDEEGAGFSRVVIQPQVPDGITWAETTRETPYGPVMVNWKKDTMVFHMHVEIPVGVRSKVMFPGGVGRYTLNGKSRSLSPGDASCELASGKYDLSYSL